MEEKAIMVAEETMAKKIWGLIPIMKG